MITTTKNNFCETGTRKEAHKTHDEKELKCCLEETRPLTDVAETKILLWLLVFVVDVSTPHNERKKTHVFCTRVILFFTTCNNTHRSFPFLRRAWYSLRPTLTLPLLTIIFPFLLCPLLHLLRRFSLPKISSYYFAFNLRTRWVFLKWKSFQ